MLGRGPTSIGSSWGAHPGDLRTARNGGRSTRRWGPARPALRLSTMEDAARAALLLSRARTSAIDEEMGRQSHAAVLDMVMVNVLQLANEAFALRATATHTGEALARTLGRADKYKEQSWTLFEKFARQQEEAKVREEDLSGRAKEAECRAEIEKGRAIAAETRLALISARLEAADKKIEELTLQLQRSKSRVDTVMDEVRVAMERAAVVERVAIDASHERAGAVAHAHKASARAEEAEGKAWEAEAWVREAGSEARIYEAEARAEAQIREAEAKVTNTIAGFKASAKFVQEVIEASFDAYVKGFELCKAKVSAALGVVW